MDLQKFVSSHVRLGHEHLSCSLFLLILLGQSASAATYYVATTGSDSNPGTSSAPFRHLSKAALTATQPGDTVIVADGTYDNEGVVSPGYVMTLYYSGTAGNPITFKAQNRGKAILDAMNTSTSTTCNGAYAYLNLYNASFIVIQGFVIQRGCNEGICTFLGTGIDYLFLEDFMICRHGPSFGQAGRIFEELVGEDEDMVGAR